MSTLNKIKSVKLCLITHPDNEKNSEFEDRISDLEEIENNFSEMFEILKRFDRINNIAREHISESLFLNIQQLLTKIT